MHVYTWVRNVKYWEGTQLKHVKCTARLHCIIIEVVDPVQCARRQSAMHSSELTRHMAAASYTIVTQVNPGDSAEYRNAASGQWRERNSEKTFQDRSEDHNGYTR